MKKISAVAILLGNFCFSQQNAAIGKPIYNLFSGMKNSDAELLKSAFSDTAILQAITKDGVKTENINDFIASVLKNGEGGTARKNHH